KGNKGSKKWQTLQPSPHLHSAQGQTWISRLFGTVGHSSAGGSDGKKRKNKRKGLMSFFGSSSSRLHPISGSHSGSSSSSHSSFGRLKHDPLGSLHHLKMIPSSYSTHTHSTSVSGAASPHLSQFPHLTHSAHHHNYAHTIHSSARMLGSTAISAGAGAGPSGGPSGVASGVASAGIMGFSNPGSASTSGSTSPLSSTTGDYSTRSLKQQYGEHGEYVLARRVIFPSGKWIVLSDATELTYQLNGGGMNITSSFKMCVTILCAVEMYTAPSQKYSPGGVYNVPKSLDELVARLHLPMGGIELSQLTAEQTRFLGIPTPEGPYKQDDYAY
ncbi:Adenosylhomocysteinase-like protein, partial [Aduncisulcus paluster]